VKNNMLLKPEMIQTFYEGAMENYNDVNGIDYEDYPAWKSLNPVMQLNIEAAIYKACEILIVDIYGGGMYNDSDLSEYINKQIAPLIDGIRLSKR